MENHDLLTNACAALERYREEEHQLEMEVSVLQARLELVREFVLVLSGKPKARRGRPRLLEGQSRSNIAEMPDRVAGGIAEAPTEPDLVA